MSVCPTVKRPHPSAPLSSRASARQPRDKTYLPEFFEMIFAASVHALELLPRLAFVARPLQTVKPVVARGVQKIQREDPILAASRGFQELLAQHADSIPCSSSGGNALDNTLRVAIVIASVWHRAVGSYCPESNRRRDATDAVSSHHETVSKPNTPDLSECVQRQLKSRVRRCSADAATPVVAALLFSLQLTSENVQQLTTASVRPGTMRVQSRANLELPNPCHPQRDTLKKTTMALEWLDKWLKVARRVFLVKRTEDF